MNHALAYAAAAVPGAVTFAATAALLGPLAPAVAVVLIATYSSFFIALRVHRLERMTYRGAAGSARHE